MTPGDPSFNDTGIPIECDAVGCRELADYRLEGYWWSDDVLMLYVCMVHLPWGAKELKAFRIEGKAPARVDQLAVTLQQKGGDANPS